MNYSFKKSQKTKEPENLEKAYEYAVFLLSLRLRTVGEVIRKMQGRGYTEQVIEKIIEQLKEQKYLNDRQYAEIFLENLKTYRTFGFYGIKKKFIDKKLPQNIIENILEVGLSLKEEEKIARRLLKKEGYEIKKSSEDEEVTYRTYGDEEQNKEKQKMANRLKSRGFRSEIISKLIF
jgi:regulatory protein